MSEHYKDIIEPSHGSFFDFSKTPKHEKPVLDYFTKHFGWKPNYPTFIRKPRFKTRSDPGFKSILKILLPFKITFSCMPFLVYRIQLFSFY